MLDWVQAMKIYTKTGDTGDTGLLGGGRVRKDDLRIEAYGTIDELNSALGVAFALEEAFEVLPYPFWKTVRSDLFRLGTELATPPTVRATIEFVEAGDIKVLEEEIDRMETHLEPLKNFILPGGSELAARLHVARTTCRRAERMAVHLNAHSAIRVECIQYLNRLSDLLFVAARFANESLDYDDVPWIPERKR